jgi:hypothetical protein
VKNGAFLSFVVSMKGMISFEDRARTLEELQSLFFNTLYLWTTALIYLFLISQKNLYKKAQI